MFANLKIDSWQKAVLYVITVIAIVLLHYMAKKRVKFSYRVLVALGLGLLTGLALGSVSTTIRPIGQLYVRLISMVVIPLVFVSILRSFTQLGTEDKLSRISVKALFWLLFTTAIATILGLVAALVFELGKGFDVSDIVYTPREVTPIETVILNLFPNNIVAHMVNNQMIPVIIFAVFIAIAINYESKKRKETVKPVQDLIEASSRIMVGVTKMVIKFTPYGVFALMANAAGRNNLETLKSLGVYIILMYAVMLIHFIVVQLGLITFVGKLSPVQFVKNIYPAQVVAFTSQSSYGTLPVTVKSLTDRVGVSENISSFVAPLGANIGMNACGGIFPAMVAIFTANAFGINLQFTDYALIVLTTTIASIGIAGVPGIATIAATVVLATLGLPIEGIALVAGVDALIDMGRTMINVTGTAVAATLTAKSEKELDLEVFYKDKREAEVIVED
ncbi:Na+/H+-dicarboxylate symporter [Acholeplasma morum]|uniref:dicarboxylate/amino acid:cation symporter n=1 Tax=Paracholeplasma morum TaxID=264637 RepID=UPI0019597805|nr:dicarboxylate/amino acid:cation symporter [Paracholeplasma morum]MBM7453947.1 Na+/H+-dicarboxylate symporter [Paracholeplasma morum]